MRRRKKLDPKTQWIVSASNQPIAPAFFHEELAKAVMKELSRDHMLNGLEVQMPTQRRKTFSRISGCSWAL